MGSFSNTVFSIMLGWLQTLVSFIWTAFTAPNGESFFQFIGKNWLIIAAVLCLVGAAADFVVYLFRWEPYKVWGTFLRRIRKKEETVSPDNPENAEQEPENPPPADRNIYKDEEEDVLYRWREKEKPENEFAEEDGEKTPAGYFVRRNSPYRKPAYSAEEENPENESDTAGEKPRRRRSYFRGILGESGEEEQFHYFAPQPVIDRSKAYHPPVFPEKWKESGDEDK